MISWHSELPLLGLVRTGRGTNQNANVHLSNRLRRWHCGNFHRLGWPLHGQQTCLVCRRVYKVDL